MDEVINIAQTTKGALGAQRSTFMEIQGKVKQLGDRFPAIRGVLGRLFTLFELQNLWSEICEALVQSSGTTGNLILLFSV